MANPFANLSLEEQMAGTPPGSPTTIALFRANRTSVESVFQRMFARLQPLQNVPPRVVRGTNATPVGPRVGGVEQIGGNSVCWTGGGLDEHNMNTRSSPASSAAYRSSDLSQVLKIEKACTAGLPESRRLPVPGPMDAKDATSAVTIVTWLREVSQAVIDRGLDAVFRANIGGKEVYLLEQWGSATKANVDAHVAWLLGSTNNVPNGMAICTTFKTYSCRRSFLRIHSTTSCYVVLNKSSETRAINPLPDRMYSLL